MPSFYPGLAAIGYKAASEQYLFQQTPILQKGKATNAFSITVPGTAGPGTAVVNTTGVDCLVMLSATVGLGGVSTSSGGTVTTGTVAVGSPVLVPVLAGASITVNYTNTGVLTWHWLPY